MPNVSSYIMYCDKRDVVASLFTCVLYAAFVILVNLYIGSFDQFTGCCLCISTAALRHVCVCNNARKRNNHTRDYERVMSHITSRHGQHASILIEKGIAGYDEEKTNIVERTISRFDHWTLLLGYADLFVRCALLVFMLSYCFFNANALVFIEYILYQPTPCFYELFLVVPSTTFALFRLVKFKNITSPYQ